MEDDNKLDDLKNIYEELWSDAKTLVKDMQKSIFIYLYAGLVTLLVGFVSAISALPTFILVMVGKGTVYSWLFMLFEIVATIIVVAFGIRFILWFSTLRKRYAKLLSMEKLEKK